MGGSAIGWTRALATLVVVCALDQGSKALALAKLTPGEAHELLLGVELKLVRNRGVAFGALAGVDGAAIIALTAVALLGLAAYFARHPRVPLLWLGVGTVLGGAAGNLLDRARHGAVIDFLDPPNWPAFNLADTAIVLGIVGVLYLSERGAERPGAEERRGGAEPQPSGQPRA
ncbi:MAG: signal peptidase II, partial [Actinomycetota bacterium]|nr:signal peptidase II [Actinomycetota bacterium]